MKYNVFYLEYSKHDFNNYAYNIYLQVSSHIFKKKLIVFFYLLKALEQVKRERKKNFFKEILAKHIQTL